MSEVVLYKRHPEYSFLFCGNNGDIYSFMKNRAHLLKGHVNHGTLEYQLEE